MKRLLALALLLAATGCKSSPTLLRALAKDPAIVSVNLVTPWGQERFVRVGGSTNSVIVSPDGTVSVNTAARAHDL